MQVFIVYKGVLLPMTAGSAQKEFRRNGYGKMSGIILRQVAMALIIETILIV